MSQTLDDVVLTNSAWTDINDVTGIDVGIKIDIQNKGSYAILLYEGDTAPELSYTGGRVVYPVGEPDSLAFVKANSLRIWGKSLGVVNTPISVQVV